MEVSIIIIHYKRVQKLYQQLNEYKNWQNLNSGYEFIVVDNNSLITTQKDKIIKDFPWLKLIFLNSNNGPSEARNIGLKKSLGTFIQFIDDDDLITYEKVKAQEQFLINNPKIDVVIGKTQMGTWTENELPKEDISKITFPDFDEVNYCNQLLKTNGFFQIGSALFRKDSLIAVNGFDEDRWLIEDVNLYLKLFKNKARFKVDKNSPFGLFWRSNEVDSLSKNNQVLFLEGCLLNYIFCVEKSMLKSPEDHIVIYSGIYNILKQGVSLHKKINDSALAILNQLSSTKRLKYLPRETLLSFFLGFSNLFKLAYTYRQIKKRIK